MLGNIKPNDKKCKCPPDNTRREEVINTHERIGHSPLTYSHLISKDMKVMCDKYKVNLSITHND